MSLESQISVGVSALLKTVQDLGESRNSLSKSYGVNLADGTAAGMADRIFHDQRTLAASANEDLDLAGVLLDPLGAALTFARIKAVIVAAAAGNTNDVMVGGAASNAFAALFSAGTGVARVRPGGVLAWVAGQADSTGYVVTPATGDLLRIANSAAGTTVTYDIVLIGASA